MYRIQQNKLFIFLLFVFVIAHIQWFKFNTILTYSDWSFWPISVIKELLMTCGTWINYFGFGKVNIQIPFILFKIFWSLGANIGLSYDQVTKITFFIPIVLLGVTS